MNRFVRIIFVAGMAAASLAVGVVVAQDASDNDKTYVKKNLAGLDTSAPTGILKMLVLPKKSTSANTMSPSLSAQAKMNAMQSMMTLNPFSLRQMISMMVAKKKVEEGISFDEVIESMDLRANSLNMKKVGHNTPYKIIAQVTGKPSPRLEIVSYCDVLVMRQILDYVPEFGAFVPCRITVLEDAKGQIWVETLDWDIRWLDTSLNPNRISKKLRANAIKIREKIESIMDAGSKGDL